MKYTLFAFIAATLLADYATSNLLTNPGFDLPYTDCRSVPDWTQVSATNTMSKCNGLDYWYHSSPYSVHVTNNNGLAGVYQNVVLNQASPKTLNITTWVWLVATAGSAQTSYTTIPFFGIQFNITYQDGTTGVAQIPYPHGFSTVTFVRYSNLYTPSKPIKSLKVLLLLDGNGKVTAMYDDVSLTEETSSSDTAATATPQPTVAATSIPATPRATRRATATPVRSTPTSGTCVGSVQLYERTGSGSTWTAESTEYKIFDVEVVNQGSCAITSAAFPYYFITPGHITQSWNLRLDSDQGYGSVILPSPVQPGNSFAGAGLIIANYTTYSNHFSASPVMCSSC